MQLFGSIYRKEKLGTDPWEKGDKQHYFSRLHGQKFSTGGTKSGLKKKFGRLYLHYTFWGIGPISNMRLRYCACNQRNYFLTKLRVKKLARTRVFPEARLALGPQMPKYDTSKNVRSALLS